VADCNFCSLDREYPGALIYWANDVYRIGVGDFTLFNLFPDFFYQATGIDHRLAEGIAWHFVFLWLFALNGVAYVTYTAVSGEWRDLVPNRRSFREVIQVALYDLHLSKKVPPARKFNGAQQIAYASIILMGAGSLVTGLAIWKSAQFGWLIALLGGYEAARIEHFLLTLRFFQIAVRTMRPFSMSRGNPMFNDTNRTMTLLMATRRS
jgi:thiosulfate reductase cytochrome b subunit